jgi:hypothetical protein
MRGTIPPLPNTSSWCGASFSTGTTLLYQRKKDILEELKVDPVRNKLAQDKQKWLDHVSRLEAIRYLKQLLHCRPIGRRNRSFVHDPKN